ncbi:MAG: hypothetical protein HZB91_01170 [Elusimicrobia bacterium]|nr:hypothetical protein [Elusimicrobiota bacterium]
MPQAALILLALTLTLTAEAAGQGLPEPGVSGEGVPPPKTMGSGLPEAMTKPSNDPKFVKARRLMDLAGEQDAESLRRSIWKQFKESQARTVSKEDAALLQANMDVTSLRTALTRLWARDFVEEDLDAAISFFVSEPGKSYLRAAEGFPGPYWKPLLREPVPDDPAFAKALRLVDAAGSFDRCRSALERKAAGAGITADPASVRNAAARQYLKAADDRTRNTALSFFESAAGRQFERTVQAQALEGPGLFRLWLTDWVTDTARRKLQAAAPGQEYRRRGFSLVPPQGWTSKTRGRTVLFRGPASPPDEEGGASLSVREEPGKDFPSFLETAERELESGLPDFILRFKEEVKVDGRNGRLLTYLHNEKNGKAGEGFKTLTLMVDAGRRFWTLTCKSPARDFEKIKGPCRQALLSFKVLSPARD